ncbi:MAG: hypothetical protein VX899_00795 [Myxococcota bacterium]|nr:hypothetical protein [Myxococcota bacterium]
MTRAPVVPSELLSVLSSQPRLRLFVGAEDPTQVVANVAAFEDRIVVFLRPDTPIVERLLDDTRSRLELDGPDGLRVRLKGRCAAGVPVMVDKRRRELLAWLEEGQDPRRLLAAPFFVHEIDYQRPAQGPRFQGRTPLHDESSLLRRLVESLIASIWPLSVLGLLLHAGFVAFKGPEMPLRPLALVLGLLALVGGQVGIMGPYRSAAFKAYRRGLLGPEQAPLLVEGRLAPRLLEQLGWVGLAVAGLAVLASLAWGWDLAVVTLSATTAWALVPLVFLRLRGEAPKR